MRLLGWIATVLHGDPSIFDRWLWLRRHLLEGELRTLDAGCGSGAYSLYAAKLGNNVVGISYNERNNRIAAERASMLGLTNVRFVTGDLRELESLAEGLGRFDQIICCETIEHVLDDQALITELGKLLRPGGRLLVTTPSDRHRPHPEGESISTSEDGRHVRYGYSHRDLERLFHTAGLDTISLGYVTGTLSQIVIWIQVKLARFSLLLAWAITVPLRFLQVFDPFVSRASKLPPFCITGIAIRRAESIACGSATETPAARDRAA